MKYFELQHAGFEISKVGLGTWPFAEDMWGKIDEKTCLDTTQAALDAGINLVDTAPFYGMGRSETIVGKALKGKRDKVILATKCGLIKEGKSVFFNLKPESIRNELELSLKRLDTDYIDLYQTHWPDPKTPIEETMEEMKKFVQEGKVKAIGLCNADRALIEKAGAVHPLATVQNEYSLLKRDPEKEVLPACEKAGIGLIAYGPLAGGILSGKYNEAPQLPPGDPRRFFYRHYKGESFEKASKVAGEVKTLADKHGTVPVAVALAWLTAHSAVATAIVGAKSPTQIQSSARAGNLEIPSLRDRLSNEPGG